MNKLTLIQRTECPPDQYRYKFKEDGYTVKCFDHPGWLERIREHRHINGYETPQDWIAEAEDQLCRLLPPGWCKQVTGEPPEWFLDARVDIEDVLRGTIVLGTFIAQGAPIVSREVASERGTICSTCPFAVNVAGCGPCVGLSNAIAEVAGKQELPSDTLLANKSCLCCKCAARAQVWLPVKFLEIGIGEDIMRTFPEWCWKKKEILQYRERA